MMGGALRALKVTGRIVLLLGTVGYSERFMFVTRKCRKSGAQRVGWWGMSWLLADGTYLTVASMIRKKKIALRHVASTERGIPLVSNCVTVSTSGKKSFKVHTYITFAHPIAMPIRVAEYVETAATA